MGLASWQRSGSLNGWQDFGHEDAAVTRNDQMRAHQLGSLLPPAGEAQLPPPVYTLGRLRADTPATADSRDRSMSGYGTKQTWRDVRLGSGMRTITDIDQWGAKPTDLHLCSRRCIAWTMK